MSPSLGAILDHPCPECGAQMVLRDSRYGRFYGCLEYPNCKATHGAHADGRPLGIPADKPTKRARMRAHDAFDSLWKGTGLRRQEAYRWLRGALNLSAEECHIGRFDIETCDRVVRLVGLFQKETP